MSRLKYINIDTRYNIDKYHFPLAEYYLELPEHIHNVISFSIVSIELPITFHNICSAFNNNSFDVLATTNRNIDKKTVIKIPDNFYTTETLHKTVVDALKDNSLNDLRLDLSNNKMKLSSKHNDYIINFTNDKNCLGNLLGFQKNPIYINKRDTLDEYNSENQTICNLFNPRYLFLEIIEYGHNKHNKNDYLFTSTLLGCHISKHIIAKVTIDYKNFPYGSLFPANLVNGFLVSNVRVYKRHINLEALQIRLLNEIGIPICLNGHEISFCCQVECQNDC